MSHRARGMTFVVVAPTVTTGAGAYAAIAAHRASARADAPPEVAVTDVAALDGAPRVVFRNTEAGSKCGVSPDRTRVAYKHDIGGATPNWRIADLDLATGQEITSDGEGRSVDDQVGWFGDDTLLYGLARRDAAGVSDIWKINTNRGSEPSLFIEQAWSPSVVRS